MLKALTRGHGGSPTPGNEQLPRSTLAVCGAVVLAIILAYRDVWPWLVSEWQDNPYYSHGVLVPVLAGFLVWRSRAALAERRTSNWGYAIVALGLVTLVLGVWWSAYWIAGFSLPIVIAGVVLAMLGPRVFRRWAFPLAFLLLMVPLPFDVWVANALEAPTATVSTAVVQPLGVPAQNKGSLIELPNAKFAVGGICAGLRSSIALFTLALFVVMVGTPGAMRNKIALLTLVVPLALVANTVRIAVLLMVAHAWGGDAAMNYYHDYSSYVFFALALGLLFLASGGLRCPLWRLQLDLRPS